MGPVTPANGYEPVIGLEIHVQLSTKTKMFCGCALSFGDEPNTHTCPICLGHPGTLPTTNAESIHFALMIALALECDVAERSIFHRKNYFYPDLPKGYQISQYDLPLARNGLLQLDGNAVRITRVHLEEDTGKLLHAGDALQTASESLVDLNRSGVPLMEIVSEPDIHSAEEARDCAIALRAILRAIGASEADMEKGQLRAEANVSVRPKGSRELGVKTELKNLNSFRALQRAIDEEIRRQVAVLESGGAIVQETRGWSEADQATFSQRSKEYAQDYRYFPEPDLPPLEVDPAWVGELRASLPELPAARRRRFHDQYGLPEFDADQLTHDPATADLFEATVAAGAPAKQAANWIIGEQPTLSAPDLADLIGLVLAGTINRDQGRQVLQDAQASGRPPGEIVRESGLAQVSDESALEAAVAKVLSENPQALADFDGGQQQAVGALQGKVKAATGGTANMQVVQRMLLDKLSR